MPKPTHFRCADLFCGAGGAAMGIHRAGFEVEGWDIKPQKHYPFTFHLGNALEADLIGFDFVWASPPCQAHTALKTMPNAKHHEDLIPATRAKLTAWGGPYIIENVPGSTLRPITMLCGTMFSLGTLDGQAELRRHRYFESNIFLTTLDCRHSHEGPAWIPCSDGCGEFYCLIHGMHAFECPCPAIEEWEIDPYSQGYKPRVINCWGHTGGSSKRDNKSFFTTEQRSEAMGIDWMTGAELSQAIPPDYAEYLAKQVMKYLTNQYEPKHPASS